MDTVHCRDADLRFDGWLCAQESRAAAYNSADKQAGYGPQSDDSPGKSESFDPKLQRLRQQ